MSFHMGVNKNSWSVTHVPDVPDVEYEEVDLTNEQCIVGCAF